MRRLIRRWRRDPVGVLLDARAPFWRGLGEAWRNRQARRCREAGAAERARAVSVVMTVFDGAGTLAAAAESILAQTHERLELLIVDDASRDDTPAIAADLARRDARVRHFRSPRNRGLFWSRNAGWLRARGEFVAFQDADDVSLPERLQVQLGALKLAPGALASVVRGRWLLPDGRAAVVDGRRERTAVASLMLRRAEAERRAGYFDTVRFAADSEYMARLRRIAGPRAVAQIGEVLYRAALRDDSLTHAGAGAMRWERDGEAGFRRRIEGARADYHAAFETWHRAAPVEALRLPFPDFRRPFAAGEGNAVPHDEAADAGFVELAAARPAA